MLSRGAEASSSSPSPRSPSPSPYIIFDYYAMPPLFRHAVDDAAYADYFFITLITFIDIFFAITLIIAAIDYFAIIDAFIFISFDAAAIAITPIIFISFDDIIFLPD
jgi:hypothetical protein